MNSILEAMRTYNIENTINNRDTESGIERDTIESNPLLDLPIEVLEQIFIRVGWKDLFILRQVSLTCKLLVDDIHIWDAKSIYDFGYSYRFPNQNVIYYGYASIVTIEHQSVMIGSEAFISIDLCLSRAFDQMDVDLYLYFLAKSDLRQHAVDHNFALAVKQKGYRVIPVLTRPSRNTFLILSYYVGRSSDLQLIKTLLPPTDNPNVDSYSKEIYKHLVLGATSASNSSNVSGLRYLQSSQYLSFM